MRPISVLVNARLQSSYIDRKLVGPYAGTTLIEKALEKLNSLDYFEHRYLAVAEEELRKYAEKYENVQVLERRQEAVAKRTPPSRDNVRALHQSSDQVPLFTAKAH